MRLALAAALVLTACGSEPSPAPIDAAAEAALPDAPPDAAPDAEPDAVPPPLDAAPDTSPDVTMDAAPDGPSAPDAAPDAAPDVSVDAAADVNPCPRGQTLCDTPGNPDACRNLLRGVLLSGMIYSCGSCNHACWVGARCVDGRCQ